MIRPLVSVVIETITSRFDTGSETLADMLGPSLASLARQTYPAESIETVVVVDSEVDPAQSEEIARLWPSVKLVASDASNYFDAKNAGARAASGEFVAFVDGDCVPDADWVERLAGRFEPGVTAVAGRVRYAGTSLFARTFSVPDFGYVVAEKDGQASGFNLGNVAFRRSVFETRGLDARLRRNGGCYQLYHELRASGARMLYEPGARVAHGIDISGLGFLRKHFERGYDGYSVYRLDQSGLFRGTALVRRFGGAALIPLTVRRIAVDVGRLARDHRQIGISILALPYFAAVAIGLRAVELAGGLAAAAGARIAPEGG
jgi:glycosyltransferase involved in cell wall biosynthesis